MLEDISNGFLTITVIVGFFFGLFLIIKNKPSKPTLFLGLFLIAYSSEGVLPWINLFVSADTICQALFFPFFSTTLLFSPFLYLYAKNLVSPISLKKELPHLIPGIAEFFLFSILFCLPIETKKWLYSSEDTANFWIFYKVISFIYSVFYLFKTIQFINKCQIDVQNFYSTLEGKLLTWVKNIAFFLGIVAAVYIITGVLGIVASEENAEIIMTYNHLALDGINLLFLGYVTIMGLKQSSLLEFAQMNLEEKQVKKSPVITYTEKESNEFYDRIIKYMESKEPYTDSNLTLSSLSSELDVQPRRLSKEIKLNTSYNFNQFINTLRVEKAKELLISPDYSHYSILGIAEEAGFNSKATFNTSFKNYVEMTPSEYKNKFG